MKEDWGRKGEGKKGEEVPWRRKVWGGEDREGKMRKMRGKRRGREEEEEEGSRKEAEEEVNGVPPQRDEGSPGESG